MSHHMNLTPGVEMVLFVSIFVVVKSIVRVLTSPVYLIRFPPIVR